MYSYPICPFKTGDTILIVNYAIALHLYDSSIHNFLLQTKKCHK